MSNKHNYSFFGQNTGIIINSALKQDPFFFIKCLKKKLDGSWEKPSANEGKIVKFSLEEIIMILEVLNRRELNWASYHSYKDIKTQISFGWEDNQAKTLWINIANYSKMLNFAQAEIFRMLLTHILKEKIIYATSPPNFDANKESIDVEIPVSSERKEYGIVEEEIIKENIPIKKEILTTPDISIEKNTKLITGSIKGETEKALLIVFTTGQEVWIPKSTIHNQYVSEKLMIQNFTVDKWILERNKVNA